MKRKTYSIIIFSYLINAVPILNNTRSGGTFYTVASPDLHVNGTSFTSLYVSRDECPGLCGQDIEVPECGSGCQC